MKMFQLIIFLTSIVCVIYAQECVISEHCKNHDGRAMCYNRECHRDVPCNKDNDCFFWAAADVAAGHPHPKCYDAPEIRRAPGYGTCILAEFAKGLYGRIPGDDVAALNEV